MIDCELIQGTNAIDLKPLSPLLTTQKLIYTIMKGHGTDDFVPYNEEQKVLSLTTEQTGGSPDIIDTTLAERLAKGQSMLTTMWQIHDESASTFMKFFYQYLMGGFRSSFTLHKA